MHLRIRWRLSLVGLLLLTGCLPYSCRPTVDEALFPADSLSRDVAQTVPADTLTSLRTASGTEAHPLSYPRTVRFTRNGSLAVSDVERNSLFWFGPDGSFAGELQSDAFAVPYLAGVREDTLVVFNAEADRVDFVVGRKRLPNRSLSFERPAKETLVYTLATDRHLYAKVVGEDISSEILRLNGAGAPTARAPLPGPRWRRAGFLRTWGDRLVSLSGFRPVVHLLPPDFADGTAPDSLSLVGFNSPMLERSYAYAQDDSSNPPLLMASAAAVDDTLFVLNLRPGWVRIDAYDRGGRLQRRLVERHETGDRDFYPLDLDVRREGTAYVFAVTIRSPKPQLRLFRWTPEGTGAAPPATE